MRSQIIDLAKTIFQGRLTTLEHLLKTAQVHSRSAPLLPLTGVSSDAINALEKAPA